MCGIVGCVLKQKSGFDKQTEDSFYEMLYADALRGWDSTGIIAVNRDADFFIAKEAVEASMVAHQWQHGEIGKAMWRDGKAYIGHNRKATVGKVTDATAHPFVVDDTFAMVHNGTLYNHDKLAKTDVDSQALAIVLKKAFDEEDYVAALGETLADVWGAYAVACYDQKRNQIHLLRNKERPLQIIEAHDAWYFASEGLMAGWILSRNNYLYKDLNVINVDVDKLYTFDLDKKTFEERAITVKKYTQVGTNTAATAHPGKTSGNTSAGSLNKKEFKKFRNKYLGQRISFWVDDFVEKNYPRTVKEDGETEILFWGTNEEIDYQHSICAEVDITPFGFNNDDSEITDRRWTAIVESVEHQEATGQLLITVIDPKPLVRSSSLVVQKETAIPEGILYHEFNRMIEGWSDGYIENYLKYKKDSLKVWQLMALEAEQNARKNVRSYKDESSATVH